MFLVCTLGASLSACYMSGPTMSGQGHPPPVQAPAPVLAAGGVYAVVPGDTIYVVARKFGTTVRALIDANGLQPPFQLSAGQVLRVPPGGDYVVVRGDTLAKVAHKTNVEFGTLARMNNLAPPYVIHVGQRLVLPTGGGVVYASAPGDTMVIQSPNAGQPGSSAAPVAPMTVEALPSPQPPPRETTTFGAATRPGIAPGATVTWASPPGATPPAASSQPVPSGSAPAPPLWTAQHRAQGNDTTDTASAQAAPQPVPQQAGAPVPPPPLRAAAPPSASPAQTATAPAAPLPPVAPVPAPAPAAAPPQQVAMAAPARPPAPPAEEVPSFIWPVHGTVLSPFGTIAKGQHNDGINIAVPKGTPVLAAGDGEVAYAGNELRGFGNLLLIKHTGTDFVTAYAHNDKLLVKKGQHVHRGQEIATSGDSGGVSQPQLHFELRQGVKPVDPQTVLPEAETTN
jgi:murein DD-endopeptidase MepM/ murein hydrolase activator NlpD